MLTLIRNSSSGIWFWIVISILVSVLCISICYGFAKMIDYRKGYKCTSLEKDHPKINLVVGLSICIIMGAIVLAIIVFLSGPITSALNWIKDMASKLDAVIIVALITAAVSLVSVLFSSVIARILEHKKNRQEYLNKRREKSYTQFVDMMYKILYSVDNPDDYPEKNMLADLEKFSKEVTLWGSRNVINKWIKFRKNSKNTEVQIENLFVLESIMNEMRKDLGVKKVKKGNLLGFYLIDIEDIEKLKK